MHSTLLFVPGCGKEVLALRLLAMSLMCSTAGLVAKFVRIFENFEPESLQKILLKEENLRVGYYRKNLKL